MIRTILPLFGLFCLAGANQIRHLQLNNADLIETTPTNYALSAAAILPPEWSTVSINGNDVLIFDHKCQQNMRQLNTLNDFEQSRLVAARQQLATVETDTPQMLGIPATRSSSATYSMGSQGNSVSTSHSRNMNIFSFNSNGDSVTKYQVNNFSVSRPNMPNNLNRVFVDGEVVTFVYNNGEVVMKPMACLNALEQQFINTLKNDVQLAERQFRLSMQQMNQNMQQMHQNMNQNMQNMQTRLQQNMQNLHQNLNGMFQNQQQMIPAIQAPSYVNPNQYRLNSYQGASTIPQYGYSGGYNQYASANTNPFTSGNFPFGPNNSPFGAGFPFSRK